MKRTACNKIGYSKREAESQARRRGRVKALRIYPCPDCGYWHLTKHV